MRRVYGSGVIQLECNHRAGGRDERDGRDRAREPAARLLLGLVVNVVVAREPVVQQQLPLELRENETNQSRACGHQGALRRGAREAAFSLLRSCDRGGRRGMDEGRTRAAAASTPTSVSRRARGAPFVRSFGRLVGRSVVRSVGRPHLRPVVRRRPAAHELQEHEEQGGGEARPEHDEDLKRPLGIFERVEASRERDHKTSEISLYI